MQLSTAGISLSFLALGVIAFLAMWAVSSKLRIPGAWFLSAYAALGSAFGGWVITLVLYGGWLQVPASIRFRGWPGVILGLLLSLGFAFYVIRDAFPERRRAALLCAIYLVILLPAFLIGAQFVA